MLAALRGPRRCDPARPPENPADHRCAVDDRCRAPRSPGSPRARPSCSDRSSRTLESRPHLVLLKSSQASPTLARSFLLLAVRAAPTAPRAPPVSRESCSPRSAQRLRQRAGPLLRSFTFRAIGTTIRPSGTTSRAHRPHRLSTCPRHGGSSPALKRASSRPSRVSSGISAGLAESRQRRGGVGGDLGGPDLRRDPLPADRRAVDPVVDRDGSVGAAAVVDRGERRRPAVGGRQPIRGRDRAGRLPAAAIVDPDDALPSGPGP